ncbi:MAG: hypothetical protein ABF238_01045 [Flavobacteriales bacterium]
MNKVLKIDKNRATTLCRSFFIALIFAGSSFLGFSQETTMYHFQRKGSLEKVILPGQRYNSSQFVISLPDSLYTAGNITIKKLKINDWKLQVNFIFSRNVYTQMVYSVKKRDKEEFIQFLENSDSIFSWQQKKIGRKVQFTLTLQAEQNK